MNDKKFILRSKRKFKRTSNNGMPTLNFPLIVED